MTYTIKVRDSFGVWLPTYKNYTTIEEARKQAHWIRCHFITGHHCYPIGGTHGVITSVKVMEVN